MIGRMPTVKEAKATLKRAYQEGLKTRKRKDRPVYTACLARCAAHLLASIMLIAFSFYTVIVG